MELSTASPSIPSTASPVTAIVPLINLTSLKGLSLTGLTGTKSDSPPGTPEPPKPAHDPETAVIQKSSPPEKPKRKRATAPKPPNWDGSKDLATEKSEPQPDAKFNVTSSESLNRLDGFLQRFRKFGFDIPAAVALTWQAQTIGQLTKVLDSWETDFVVCNEYRSVIPASSRDLVPPLISNFDDPISYQLIAACNEGRAARIIHDSLPVHNPYPVATKLAMKWIEGLESVHAATSPTSVSPATTQTAKTTSPIPSPSTAANASLIQSGIRRAQSEIDRQSRIDSLLSQLFDERDTVASLQEEITETKAALKTLTESRDEHQAEEERIIEMLKVESENNKE